MRPYPLHNWLACRVVRYLRGEEDEPTDLGDWIAQSEAIEEARDRSDPKFWNALTASECRLVSVLAKSTEHEARKAVDDIAAGYRRAERHGSPREWRSVLEHLDWLIDLLDVKPRRRTAQYRRALGILQGIRRKLGDLDVRNIRRASSDPKHGTAVDAERVATPAIARRRAHRPGADEPAGGLDLAALADRHLGEAGGVDLRDAGPRTRGLHEHLRQESSTTPVAAGVFWQSFLGSEDCPRALERLAASEGAKAAVLGRPAPARSAATRGAPSPDTRLLRGGEAYIVRHGRGRPRHDLVVFDADLAPGTVRAMTIEAAASTLRSGWDSFQSRQEMLDPHGLAGALRPEIAVEASSRQPFGLLIVGCPKTELTAIGSVSVPAVALDVRVKAEGEFASAGAGFWKNLWKTRAKDWIYESLEASQVSDSLQQTPIEPDTAYLNVFLRWFRIVNVRVGLKKFYGTVHSYISVPYEGSTESAEFQVVTTPPNLKDQDTKHLDRVITRNIRLLGPIPYRGGDVDLEVGLFSVKSADLAGPYVEVLETMATAAGVSFVSVAKPFLQPIETGINLLTGAADDTILEIGLSTTLDTPKTGYFFVMRAQKGTVDVSKLRVSSDFRLVDEAGNAIEDFPYMVLAVEATEKRDDWFQIPELHKLYETLRLEAKKGDVEETQKALATFERAVRFSPDLLTRDAKQLIEKVREKFSTAFAGALTSASTLELPDFEGIDLYGS